jgi:hypothetical protein
LLQGLTSYFIDPEQIEAGESPSKVQLQAVAHREFDGIVVLHMVFDFGVFVLFRRLYFHISDLLVFAVQVVRVWDKHVLLDRVGKVQLLKSFEDEAVVGNTTHKDAKERHKNLKDTSDISNQVQNVVDLSCVLHFLRISVNHQCKH